MEQLENEQFLAVIDVHGAEINHIYNKQDHFDYIWNNDIWPKHAPVLFPAIGRSNEDAYLYQGKTYSMPQHGFSSQYDFTVVSKTATKLVLTLSDNQETYAYYPFHFALIVTFTLTTTGLQLNFVVQNKDEKELSFSLGSHPAFNLPIAGEGQFSDYQVTLSPAVAQIKQFEIVKTPNPYRSGKILPLAGSNKNVISLTHKLFDAGLIVIENKGLTAIKVSSPKSQHAIELSLNDFRYVTLWTKEGANAPFLCVEPFAGLPDVVGTKRELLTKEANTVVAAQAAKQFTYAMTLS
ncbi:aldose 1-epimerase family protein [Loigolactobacillus jiayinensis]|uniref:Aldose 1-epimerase family protein n=1 Tax=Loigolactobacillus jiayinensis TaxID=2486016 RepID=A0ABW1RD84_9LACO|nr:aldose 1-epimerase family protein [Loigolactobacillus jiayinensis]